MANIELEVKAADKRLTNLEKAVNGLTLDLRKFDTGTNDHRVSAIEKGIAVIDKRMSTLETIIKSLAAATKAGGNTVDKIELKAMIDENHQKHRTEMQKHILTKNDAKEADLKVKEIKKEADLLNLTLKTVTAKQEKHASDEKARVDKLIADQRAAGVEMAKQIQAQSKELGQQAQLEVRLKTLEALVQSALTLAAKR